jgi:hypothetical protein
MLLHATTCNKKALADCGLQGLLGQYATTYYNILVGIIGLEPTTPTMSRLLKKLDKQLFFK